MHFLHSEQAELTNHCATKKQTGLTLSDRHNKQDDASKAYNALAGGIQSTPDMLLHNTKGSLDSTCLPAQATLSPSQPPADHSRPNCCCRSCEQKQG